MVYHCKKKHNKKRFINILIAANKIKRSLFDSFELVGIPTEIRFKEPTLFLRSKIRDLMQNGSKIMVSLFLFLLNPKITIGHREFFYLFFH